MLQSTCLPEQANNSSHKGNRGLGRNSGQTSLAVSSLLDRQQRGRARLHATGRMRSKCDERQGSARCTPLRRRTWLALLVSLAFAPSLHSWSTKFSPCHSTSGIFLLPASNSRLRDLDLLRIFFAPLRKTTQPILAAAPTVDTDFHPSHAPLSSRQASHHQMRSRNSASRIARSWRRKHPQALQLDICFLEFALRDMDDRLLSSISSSILFQRRPNFPVLLFFSLPRKLIPNWQV